MSSKTREGVSSLCFFGVVDPHHQVVRGSAQHSTAEQSSHRYSTYCGKRVSSHHHRHRRISKLHHSQEATQLLPLASPIRLKLLRTSPMPTFCMPARSSASCSLFSSAPAACSSTLSASPRRLSCSLSTAWIPSAKVSILNSNPSSTFRSRCCVSDLRSLCDCRLGNIDS